MDIQYLPEDVLGNVIDYVSYCMKRGAPDGKKEFMKMCLNRNSFFPLFLQNNIDEYRDSRSRSDYLFSHPLFSHKFGPYKP